MERLSRAFAVQTSEPLMNSFLHFFDLPHAASLCSLE